MLNCITSGEKPWARMGAGALIAVLVAIIYGQTRAFDFIRYDDYPYILDNPMVRQGIGVDGLIWAFTGFDAANWHPLTWLSHMLDVTLFGLDPGAHHLVSVGWHLANALLLLSLMVRLTAALWPSLAVAVVFAVHPLHVESVAWIAERKDLVSSFWGLASLWAYGWYARRPGSRPYAAVAFCFALSLMAKPMLVTLPVLMLVIDYWPLQRHLDCGPGLASRPAALVAEKLPLLVLSAASALITVYAQQQGGAVESLEVIPPGLRAANAAVSYWVYLAKTVWPVDLAVFYPYDLGLPLTTGGWAAVALALVTAVTWGQRLRYPWLLAGWLWYLIGLLPVIGLIQVGAQARADRYTYLPLTGIVIALAWTGQMLGRRFARAKPLITGGGVLAVVLLTLAARHQAAFWENGVALFGRAIAVTSANAFAHNNLGLSLADRGDHALALIHYRQALAIRPTLAQAHNNMGVALEQLGDIAGAVDHFRQALRLRPDLVPAHVNLGLALGKTATTDQAVAHLRQALLLDPKQAQAHHGLAMILADQGRWQEARAHFQAAVEASGHRPDYLIHLGNALMALGRLDQAIDRYAQALELSPQNTDALNNLGVALARGNRPEEARACLQRVLALDPGNREARDNLARLDRLGRGQPTAGP